MGTAVGVSQGDIANERRQVDIFLQPGEFFWGDQYTRIWTILGSCVAVCVMHTRAKVGGMNHIQLPGAAPEGKSDRAFPAKYSDDAMDLVAEEIRKTGLKYEEFSAKVFGGSSLFENGPGGLGERNLASVMAFLERMRIPVIAMDGGGTEHRKIIFDPGEGTVWVRKSKGTNG